MIIEQVMEIFTVFIIAFISLAILLSAICTKILIHKPTQEEKEELILKSLYHYTSDVNVDKIDLRDGTIFLKKSKRLDVNLFNLFRPAVYFL